MQITFRRTALAVLALAVATPSSAADQPLVLAPSAEWAVTGDNESCWISRHFGSDDSGVTFSLHAFSPQNASYLVVVRGDPLPQRTSGALDFEYRFNPDSEAIPTTGILNTGGGVPRISFSSTLEPASVAEARRNGEAFAPSDAARETAINELVLAFSRGKPLSLQLGSLARPMQQLRECTAQLPAKWGLDPTVQQRLSRRPVPIDIGTWLGPGSYPWEYLHSSLSVRVQMRLMTDESGGVTGCMVQSPSGMSSAGTLVCREIIKTAHFEPALDAAGDPVPSYYSTSIVYYTPRRNGPGHGASRTQGL